MVKQRRNLLAEVDAMSAEQLTHHPEQGSWSALEVVEHLVRVDEAIVSRAGKRRERRTWPEAVRATFALGLMSVLLRLGKRVRAPVRAILPQGGATLADLAVRWDAAHEGLRRTLEGIGRADALRPVFRHPVLGLLTPGQTLAFMDRHLAHHRRQIGRIRRSPGYPQS